MKIKNGSDIEQVYEQIMGKMISQKGIVYFNVLVSDLSGNMSNCYFSPVTPIQKNGKNMVFTDDVKKLIKILLSHPNMANLEYDAEKNVISATFTDESELFEGSQ